MNWPSPRLMWQALRERRALATLTLPERDQRLGNLFVGPPKDRDQILRSVNAIIWLQQKLGASTTCGLAAHQRAHLLVQHGHKAQVDYGVIEGAPQPNGHCRLLIDGQPLSEEERFISLRRTSAVVMLESWWHQIRDGLFSEAATQASSWDWDFEGDLLIGELRFQGVAAFCGRALRDTDLGVPEPWRQQLLQDEQRALLRSQAQDALIEELQIATQDRSIDWLILKGRSLSRHLYREGERDSRDLDILVAPQHHQTLETQLINRGFVPRPGHQRTFRRGGLEIDLHSKLSDIVGAVDAPDEAMPVRWKISTLFDESIERDGLRQLSSMDAWITGAVHWTVRHGGCGWIWQEDLRRQQRSLDLNELKARAQSVGLLSIVDLTCQRLDNSTNWKPARHERHRHWQNWQLFRDWGTRRRLLQRAIWPSTEYLEATSPGPGARWRHLGRVLSLRL